MDALIFDQNLRAYVSDIAAAVWRQLLFFRLFPIQNGFYSLAISLRGASFNLVLSALVLLKWYLTFTVFYSLGRGH